ncbi:MAG: hypothetical protein J4F98_05630 [Acidobacteria bacterium]|nr:hypothetical protein [Acidobacteriota bacterium]
MSRLEKTLDEVRDLLAEDGVTSELHGSVASLEQAGPDQLAFAKDERTLRATDTRAGALFVPLATSSLSAHQIVVEDPFAAFVVVLRHIDRERRSEAPGVHPTAVVSANASIGADVVIGPGVTVRDEAEIGDRSVLHANSCVGRRSRIGPDCILFPGRDGRCARYGPRRHRDRLRRLRVSAARRPPREDPPGRHGRDRR